MGEQEMDKLYQFDVLSRSQARQMLRDGIAINISFCPENTYAGIYAAEVLVPCILNAPHFGAGSVRSCMLLLSLAPCGLAPDSNPQIFLALYNSLLSNCSLQSVGL